jgi:two-component system cell cycle sensor histidine kinase/response regulator CckA
MLASFLKTSRNRPLLLSMQNKAEFLIKLATPEHFKQLWSLVIGNILVIGCLGGVLVMMSSETAHLILSMGVTLCAAIIVGVAGYICWLSVLWSKDKAFVIGGLDSLKQAIMVTDENGDALFTNRYLQNSFGNLEKNVVQILAKEFVAQEAVEDFSKFYAAVGCDTVCEATILMNTKETLQGLWKITITSIDHYKGYRLWILDPIHEYSSELKVAQSCTQSSMNFYNVFEHAPMGIVLLNNEGKFLASNQFFREQMFQNEPLKQGQHFLDLLQEDCRDDISTHIQEVIQGQKLSVPIEISFEAYKSEVLSVFIGRADSNNSLQAQDRQSAGVILHFMDNAEQKKLHLQLVQSQKMQAMGQLAGGIAHDFNNLLTAMIGFCDLLLMRHSPGDQSFGDIMQIVQNANRAANLVRQLLAFSKQQTLQPQILNVIDAVTDLSVLLQRLIGVNIRLDINYGQELGFIKVDRGQFEQVIINLVVNARDAMNGQGELGIKAFNKNSTKSFHINHEVLPAGAYVIIEITDTGTGIQKEHLPRIFDPFFSTKEVGQGTGLGLSTVYGIIKQTGGHIFVDSVLNKGTKFSLVLPSYASQGKTPVLEASKIQKSVGDLTGVGTLLFVEDEDAVRLFGTRALRDKGYNVVEASNGEEALKYITSLVHKSSEKIDLLITDVVMPNLDGPTLVEKAHEIFPELKVIYISGYAEDSFRQRLGQEGGIHFLPKPFSLKELALKVKEVMNTLPGPLAPNRPIQNLETPQDNF